MGTLTHAASSCSLTPPREETPPSKMGPRSVLSTSAYSDIGHTSCARHLGARALAAAPFDPPFARADPPFLRGSAPPTSPTLFGGGGTLGGVHCQPSGAQAAWWRGMRLAPGKTARPRMRLAPAKRPPPGMRPPPGRPPPGRPPAGRPPPRKRAPSGCSVAASWAGRGAGVARSDAGARCAAPAIVPAAIEP